LEIVYLTFRCPFCYKFSKEFCFWVENKLMRLEHYSVHSLKAQILEVIGKYLDLSLYRVFFFGSRVSGFN